MRRLLEHYRIPEMFAPAAPQSESRGPSGFFKLSEGTICYGATDAVSVVATVDEPLPTLPPSELLPFDADELIDNLLLERYPLSARQRHPLERIVRPAYYALRPLLPVPIRKPLQRLYLSGWEKIPFPAWPVDSTVERIYERSLAALMISHGLDELPFIWFWPDGFESCAIVTHDVETERGQEHCSALMDLDAEYDIPSSFQIIPESRYEVSSSFLAGIRDRGFEINVHDLNHDGNLYVSEHRFLKRVGAINEYGRRFQASGFRAGVMYRNPQWFHHLQFEYEMSIPNVAHLEPQQGGCCTVFPYFIGNLLELPLTVIEDYALFNYLQQNSIDLWMEQITQILSNNGLVSILVHPDYIRDRRRQQLYRSLLSHLDRLRREQRLLIAKPKEVNDWWRTRNELRLVPDGSGWRIDGTGAYRAQIAYACREGLNIKYRLASTSADSTGASPGIRTVQS